MWCNKTFTWDWIIQHSHADRIWDAEKIDNSNVHARLIKQEDKELQFVVVCPHCKKDQAVCCENPIPERQYSY